MPGFKVKTIEAAREWMFRGEDMVIRLISREDSDE